MASNASFFQDWLATVTEQGRALLPKALFSGGDPAEQLQDVSRALISNRGEASGMALARQVLDAYRASNTAGRTAFFEYLSTELHPDAKAVQTAATAYAVAPDDLSLARLRAAVESPRQEFFRRLNRTPGATAEIVKLREDLLKLPHDHIARRRVDPDLSHLLQSWFNPGFLVLRPIDWQTPAALLERIIAYEAVHEINGWEDLRRRLDAADRRCFAFFHPSLNDDPLIFVEVALAHEMSDAIQPILDAPRRKVAIENPTTAVFYSISNCQDGLKGISLGNFLIKQVADSLLRELPSLTTFATLSPVPGFRRWIDGIMADAPELWLHAGDREALQKVSIATATDLQTKSDVTRKAILGLAADYFLNAKRPDGRPVDSVARFHLGNGARLQRVNWAGDVSRKGQAQAYGLMVNYRYDLKDIERNHEAFVNDGTVAASRTVRAHLRPALKPLSPPLPQIAAPKGGAKVDASAVLVDTAGATEDVAAAVDAELEKPAARSN